MNGSNEDFEPAEIMGILARHRVKYVVIGGVAMALHGAPHSTEDMDIRPATSGNNLERLVAALKEMGAEIRVSGEDSVPFDPHPDLLGRVAFLNLSTPYGMLDVCLDSEAVGDYDDLRSRAHVVTIHGNRVAVAALEDIIRSKQAADREQDRLVLPVLRRMLEEGEHLGSEA